MQTEKLLLSVNEVAALLGIGRSPAYDLAKRADFPIVKIGTRILIPRVALEHWIEAQAAANAPESR